MKHSQTFLLVVAAIGCFVSSRGDASPAEDRKDRAATADASPPPSWDELDARPLPSWYDEAKFGIFIHWGVFSVPSYVSEWLWAYPDAYRALVNRTERPNFSYQEYASRFTAELYQPTQWAEAFAQSGAQYVVLTSKHHEGYCTYYASCANVRIRATVAVGEACSPHSTLTLCRVGNWNSKDVPTTWNWNVMDIGPKRDILGELAAAVKQQTSPYTDKALKFGVYHSLYEWYNPLYQTDRANNYTTQHFVDGKTMAELYDLVQKYQPELIWSDGEWEAPSDYWKARDFLHWYGSNSSVAKTAVWNDRWGKDTLCKHGGFLTCTDRYSPNQLQPRKWENAFTIDTSSWGFNRNSTIDNYMTVQELVHTLIQVVALNGNVLINVGPNADGTISPIFIDRLLGMGTV
jgi:alpha-L-fucosidase